MYLEDHNIETRYMVPLLSQPYYIKLFGDLSKEYPIAAHVDENGFYIGCHQGIDQEALDYVLEVFKDFFKTRNSK